MVYVIDRIENSIAVCESLDTGDKLEITVSDLPKGVKEGDMIQKDGDGYVVNAEATKQRKAELSGRLDRLFKKNQS